MPLFTVIAGTAAYQVSPVFMNQDGSVTGTVRYGVLREDPANAESNVFYQVSEQAHYLSAAEAQAVLQTMPKEGETLKDALERGFSEALMAKGALPK